MLQKHSDPANDSRTTDGRDPVRISLPLLRKILPAMFVCLLAAVAVDAQVTRQQLEEEFRTSPAAQRYGPPTDTDFVTSLYWRYLGDRPDINLRFHVRRLNSGQISRQQLEEEFRTSPAARRHGPPTDLDFVTSLYWRYLGDKPDANLQFHANRLMPTPQISINVPLSPDSQFLNKWADEVDLRLPLQIGQVELTGVSSFCPVGCDNSSQDSFLALDGWTPRLRKGRQRDDQAKAIKPALLIDYCTSGAVQRKLNLVVAIFDRNKNNALADSFTYEVTPADCPTPAPPNNTNNTGTLTEDQFWNSIKNSSDPQDYQNYLTRFGQNGKYASLARLRISQLPKSPKTPATPKTVEDQFWELVKDSKDPNDFQKYLDNYPNGKYAPLARLKLQPTPPNNPGNTNLSVEDQFWNSVKNSKDPNDYQRYLNNFPNGKYAPLARLKISRLPKVSPPPQPPTNTSKTVEDMYWDNIKNSTRASDFQGYLNNYPNGKYAALARLKIQQNPTPAQLEEQRWDRIKNSRDAADFQAYLNDFPNGKHVRAARLKKNQLDQEQAEFDFLRNAQFGSLNEIVRFRRVFITASDQNSRGRIVDELRKDVPSLIIVSDKQNADFFIEYKLTVTSACDPGTSTAAFACELHTGKLWVHTRGLVGTGNEFNRILWSATRTKSYNQSGVNLFTKNPAAQAADSLAKALRRLNF